MKVLFAVSNEKMSESIVKQYQKEYKQIISYKNVYYFNAILKEIQRDKEYDRIVISEDLEQFTNLDYQKMDKFLFERLDSISDEASNINGEDIPIILICSERRAKSEPILVKLFGIGIYNAIIGNDRSVNEVCRLINRPRSKKEAKIYYKIDTDDVTYEKDNEDDVSELEIQNILAHYKRLGNDEEKYVESFDSIASQYNDAQLKVISKFLPLNVRAVLEERSPKYQEINSYNNKISDTVRVNSKKQNSQKGTSEIFLKTPSTRKLNEPVIVPSAIDTTKKRKILTKTSEPKKEFVQERKEEIKNQIQEEIEDILEPEDTYNMEDLNGVQAIEEIEQPAKEEQIQEQPTQKVKLQEEPSQEQLIQEQPIQEQPIKRKRGRPRKIVEEPVVQTPKRKRGRPRKVAEPIEEEVTLPGIGQQEPEEEMLLPGIEQEPEEEMLLPGMEQEPEEEMLLPGMEQEQEEEITTLPGMEQEQEEEITTLPGIEQESEETALPGIKTIVEDNSEIDNEYNKVLQNLKIENEKEEVSRNNELGRKREEKQYPELDMENLLSQNQKVIAFVGTSKNGTSFLINNVAELLSANGIDTAILDLTNNRNAYFIYTKNEDALREQSNYIMENLIKGRATGLPEHKNLTIYTSPYENNEELENVEPIIETLVKNHTVILMDCDFTTPMRYFKYAQEIYLVQSMDILTIQPLTLYLKQLSDKGMLEESKVRVILNKFMRTREINEELLIGGISIYNDAGMTVRKELFNRRTVKYITIPFELKTYLRYLDGLVVCDVSLKGYSKEFMQSLKKLASMIYEGEKAQKGKYMPPSVKNNNNAFSSNMNNTLDRMKRTY